MKAVVFTLGCKVNQCESAAVMNGLRETGWEVSDALGFADLYIINTCAVTAEAEKKSRQAIERVSKFNRSAEIIIMGCASEKSPEDFISREGVTVVVGARSKDKVLDYINKKGVFIEKRDEYYEKYMPSETGRTRAYIKIQDGCDNFCSYCIIPYLRGRSRSRPAENVRKEILARAPLEAVITGINISDYKYDGMGLADLIGSLSDVPARIRLGSLEVGVVDEKLLDATHKLVDFAPHFHLSLQSGSDNVLRAMNRKYTAAEYEKKVELIRSHYPSAAVTTDIIVGFSSETKSDFEESKSFAERICFADIHCFPYSKREGTAGASLKELPPSVKKERLAEMLALKATLKSKFISQNLSKVLEIVPEEIVNGRISGYTGNYIRVYVDGAVLPAGKMKVRLSGLYADGALGETVDQ